MITNRIAFAALTTAIFISCSTATERQIFKDAPAVGHYFHKLDDGSMVFNAGPYKGGTAFIDGSGAAYWVKDGKGYTVNDEAQAAAPDLPGAPDGITFDEAFVAAAFQE